MLKSLTLSTAIALVSTAAFAYQVTGPVTAVSDKTITVQKGDEKWEISRGSANIPSDVQVGSKITVEYGMTASKVTVKEPAKTNAAGTDKAQKNEKLSPAAGTAKEPMKQDKSAPASTTH